LLHPPVISCLLLPSIPPSTPPPSTLHLCPSLQVTDRVTQPRRTAENCVFVCVLTSMFLKAEDRKTKDSDPNGSARSANLM
jgi:hypothetical protein